MTIYSKKTGPFVVFEHEFVFTSYYTIAALGTIIPLDYGRKE